MNTKRINRMLNLVMIVALALVGWGGPPSQMTRAAGASLAQLLPVESLLNPDGTLNTSTSASGALDLRGWNVTLDPARGPVLTRDAPSIVGPKWFGLANNGLNYGGWVNALAVSGSDLYVGGSFYETYDGTITNLINIAKYSGGTWSALANNGLNNEVYTFAVIGSDLYVGGAFTQTGDGTVLNCIARYNTGTNTWSALANNGLDYFVHALAVIGSDLYVGGEFSVTKDGTVTNLNHIARYSGGTWSPLANNGLSHNVTALAVIGSDLYAGGQFGSTADGTVTNLNYIAKYSGGAWSALANHGLNARMWALAAIGSDLYAGGDFIQTYDGTVTDLNHIARYNTGTNTWSALANKGLSNIPWAFAAIGSDLYVGGYFEQTGDGTVTLHRIAKYSGGVWSALPGNGLNNTVEALAVIGSDLYAGGDFYQTADGRVKNLVNIAKLVPSYYDLYIPLVIKH